VAIRRRAQRMCARAAVKDRKLLGAYHDL